MSRILKLALALALLTALGRSADAAETQVERGKYLAAITNGERPDGRVLAPIMPWNDLAHLTKADALAIAAYLQSLPPISRPVGGPFGPTETPWVFVYSIQPGEVYARLSKPPAQ